MARVRCDQRTGQPDPGGAVPRQQPVMLSRQLNALERECGTRLFNRTGRGVELSEMGAHLFPQVKALLTDAQQLEDKIRGQAREPTGRVTLGCLPSIATAAAGGCSPRFAAATPRCSLKVLEGSSGQVEEWLADARVDIAILYRYGPSLPETEQSLAVVDSYLIGAAGDELRAAAEIAFSALHDLPFILPSAPNGLRTALDAMARQHHITLAPAIEADSLPLQKSLVETESSTRCCRCTPCGMRSRTGACRRQGSQTRRSSAPWRWPVQVQGACTRRHGSRVSDRARSSTRWRAPACGARTASRDDRLHSWDACERS